jgi:hypothetical protein
MADSLRAFSDLLVRIWSAAAVVGFVWRASAWCMVRVGLASVRLMNF